jgi:hypothetical protein
LNFAKAQEQFEQALSRVTQHTQTVTISFHCSNGGITDISIVHCLGGICTESKIKGIHDPDKARVVMHYILHRIKAERQSGTVALVLLCSGGNVYDARKVEEENNLFGKLLN